MMRCRGHGDGLWTAAAGANEVKPINCVSWYEASAFCIWDGGFLPTELEWQYAAANGAQNQSYPWLGSAGIDANHARYGYCSTGISLTCDQSAILSVGSLPAGAGRWGQLDLAGNLWEWVFDYRSDTFPPADPCDNCANNQVDPARMIRGGSFAEDLMFQGVNYRGSNDPPDSVWYNVGLRCARPAP